MAPAQTGILGVHSKGFILFSDLLKKIFIHFTYLQDSFSHHQFHDTIIIIFLTEIFLSPTDRAL